MAVSNSNKILSVHGESQRKRHKSLLDDSHLLDLVPSEIDPVLGTNTNSDTNNEHQGDDDEEDEEALFENLDYPSTGQVSNAFQRKQLAKLSELLKDINRQLPQSVKINQSVASKRISKAETTIDALRRENMALKEKLKQERMQITALKREQTQMEKDHRGDLNRLQSIIDDARELESQFASKVKNLEKSGQFETIDNTLELRSGLVQVLTGLNCYQLEEDDESLYFSINQTSVHAQFNYQLVINKGEESGDVLFIPDWEKPISYMDSRESWDENVKILKSLLPSYLHSDLIFGSDTLHSFYLKISRCLKKDEK